MNLDLQVLLTDTGYGTRSVPTTLERFDDDRFGD